jgi:hypothetical protein
MCFIGIDTTREKKKKIKQELFFVNSIDLLER